MPDDRLSNDRDNVENLEDIIESRDADTLERDSGIPEDIDVDEALTFPHPRRKADPNADVDLMDTPHKEDIEVNWEYSQLDQLPSDYMAGYDEAITTDAADDVDEVRADQVHMIGEMDTDDLTNGTPIIPIPRKGFRPEEDASDEFKPPGPYRRVHE